MYIIPCLSIASFNSTSNNYPYSAIIRGKIDGCTLFRNLMKILKQHLRIPVLITYDIERN